MYGFALSALIFFVLGAHLYCTHQPGSGDSFKGAGAAAAITAVLRQPARRPYDRQRAEPVGQPVVASSGNGAETRVPHRRGRSRSEEGRDRPPP